MNKQRLLFVNDEMVMGGVARILITMLGKLDQNEFEIDVLILHPHGELLNLIPAGIRVLDSSPFFKAVDVNLNSALKQGRFADVFNKIGLLLTMKFRWIESRIIRERQKLGLDKNPYDVEIAAKEGFCTVFVANGKSKRKLNWIHVDYSAQNYSAHHMELLKRSLTKIDLNIAVSRRSAQAYQELFGVKKIITINNPINNAQLIAQAQEPCPLTYSESCVNLITVARFHRQKAVDRIIKGMALLKDRSIKAHLYIVGSGELENDLIQLTDHLGVRDDVTFVGQKPNPLPYIRQADLFVLSSLYEGYPTTIIESFFAGTPVLTTDVSGVQEQIIEEVNGWIVPNDVDSLNTKLVEVCQDIDSLRQMRHNLLNYDYDNERITKTFLNALRGKIL